MPSHRFIVNTIYVVGFLDLLGVSMIIPLLSKHYKDIGTSASVMGLVSALYGGVQLFAGPVVGRWSDRSGRKFVLLICLFLSSISYILLGATNTVVLLLISRIIAGLFKHSQELCKALLADITPTYQHSAVFGRFNSVSNIGFIFGPLIGGHISDLQHGFSIMCLTAGILFIINLVLAKIIIPDDDTTRSRLQTESSHVSSQKSNGHLSLVDTLRTLLRSGLWDIFLVRFLLGLAVLIFRSNLALDLDARYGASGKMIGYLISYSGVVGTAAGFAVGPIASFYQNDAKLLLHASVVQLMALVCIAFAPNMLIVAFGLTLLGIVNAIARVTSLQVTLVRAGQQETGTLMGLGASVLAGARMLSPLVAGFADDGLLLMGSVSAAAVVALIGVLLLWVRMSIWQKQEQPLTTVKKS